MDLKKIDVKTAAEKGFEFNFVRPDNHLEEGEDGRTDIYISVKGFGSRAHKQAQAEFTHAMEALKKGAYKGKVDPQAEEELTAELVAKCTTGWRGIERDGKPVEWSVEEAARVFFDFPVLRDATSEQMFNYREQLKNV